MARDSMGNSMGKKISISSMHNGGMKAPPKMKADEADPSTSAGKPGEDMGGGNHSELHENGDGSFKTVKGGAEEEHPNLHHALTSMAAHHAPGEMHHMAHHDGLNLTSHHVGSDGKVQGPTEHPDMESMKEHMGQAMEEEGTGPRGNPMDEGEPVMPHSGGGGALY